MSSLSWSQENLYSELRQARNEKNNEKILKLIDEQNLLLQSEEQKEVLLLLKALTLMDQLEKTSDSGIKNSLSNKIQTSFQSLTKIKGSLESLGYYFFGLWWLSQNKESEAEKSFLSSIEIVDNLKIKRALYLKLIETRIRKKKFHDTISYLNFLEKEGKTEDLFPDVLFQRAIVENSLGHKNEFCKRIKKLFIHYPDYEKIRFWNSELSKNQWEGKDLTCNMDFEERTNRLKNLERIGLKTKAEEEIQFIRSNYGVTQSYSIDLLEAQYLTFIGEASKALLLLRPYEKEHTESSFMLPFASIAARAGQHKLAVETYYKLYLYHANSSLGRQTLYQSAFLSYQIQDYDESLRLFQEYVQKYPKSGLSQDARWYTGWIQYLRKDFQASIVTLSKIKEKLRKSSPLYEKILFWIAMSYFRSDQLELAKNYFNELRLNFSNSYYMISAQVRWNQMNSLRIPSSVILNNTQTKEQEQQLQQQLKKEKGKGPLSENDQPNKDKTEENEESLILSPVTAEIQKQEPSFEMIIGRKNDQSFASSALLDRPQVIKRLEKVRRLSSVGLEEISRWELYDIEQRTDQREILKLLIPEYERIDNFQRSSFIAQIYFSPQVQFLEKTPPTDSKILALTTSSLISIKDKDREFWKATFPKAFESSVQKYAREYALPEELIWAIMHAESRYRKDALSPVGAMGLMQIMPFTAQKVAHILKIPDYQNQQLFQPDRSIQIGGKYLQRLMNNFEQNIALTAAGYNAGPHRVFQWLSSFGRLDLDEFIEHIPYLETRNYVKKVVYNYFLYSHLYKNKTDTFLSFLKDPLNLKIPTPLPSKEVWE